MQNRSLFSPYFGAGEPRLICRRGLFFNRFEQQCPPDKAIVSIPIEQKRPPVNVVAEQQKRQQHAKQEKEDREKDDQVLGKILPLTPEERGTAAKAKAENFVKNAKVAVEQYRKYIRDADEMNEFAVSLGASLSLKAEAIKNASPQNSDAADKAFTASLTNANVRWDAVVNEMKEIQKLKEEEKKETGNNDFYNNYGSKATYEFVKAKDYLDFVRTDLKNTFKIEEKDPQWTEWRDKWSKTLEGLKNVVVKAPDLRSRKAAFQKFSAEVVKLHTQYEENREKRVRIAYGKVENPINDLITRLDAKKNVSGFHDALLEDARNAKTTLDGLMNGEGMPDDNREAIIVDAREKLAAAEAYLNDLELNNSIYFDSKGERKFTVDLPISEAENLKLVIPEGFTNAVGDQTITHPFTNGTYERIGVIVTSSADKNRMKFTLDIDPDKAFIIQRKTNGNTEEVASRKGFSRSGKDIMRQNSEPLTVNSSYQPRAPEMKLPSASELSKAMNLRFDQNERVKNLYRDRAANEQQ